METLDSFEADMDIKMGIETMGVSMDVPMQYNVKAAGLKGDNPVTFSTVSMTMMGVTMKTEAYTEGEWCYITAFGQGMKMKAGENTEEYDGYADIESVIKEIPEDILSDVEITENSDGTKTVSVAVSDENSRSSIRAWSTRCLLPRWKGKRYLMFPLPMRMSLSPLTKTAMFPYTASAST